jgi:catechol 2,3-dioxygenase-like lactoylglutathione lyase family enzyme
MSKFRSMRMKQIALVVAVGCFSSSLAAQVQPTRPKITGIDHVLLYVASIENARTFYTKILGLPSDGGACVGVLRPCFPVSSYQQIELEKVPSPAPKNWLAELAFSTDDVAQMRRYLLAHGVRAAGISVDTNGVQHFELHDPEGNPIAFVQRRAVLADYKISPEQLSARLIHAGFVVKNLDAENHFYVDLLGFRLYWRGGFKDRDTDWYEIQVPDGDNWIEYMLNIPATADHKELGVQNHFSLGVKDANSAAAQLRKNGLQQFDGPEIGRDGKNSLDAYDPDGTRVEIMEFAPSQKPCCHPYTADHPKP